MLDPKITVVVVFFFHWQNPWCYSGESNRTLWGLSGGQCLQIKLGKLFRKPTESVMQCRQLLSVTLPI